MTPDWDQLRRELTGVPERPKDAFSIYDVLPGSGLSRSGIVNRIRRAMDAGLIEIAAHGLGKRPTYYRLTKGTTPRMVGEVLGRYRTN